jgi:GNAT superfamily N-acetyltransferase
VTGPEPTVVVREARPEEHERIAELTLAAYLEIPGVADDPAYLAELADVAGRAAVVPLLVAVDVASDTVLGTVTFVPGPGPYSETEGPDEAGFRMLAVDPGRHRRGVGRALVEACIARARAAGKRRLVLLTTPAMTAAHRLYERLGFDRDPANDWEYEPGRWLWAYALDLEER